MTEDFLHFIWKFGLFKREGLLADTGELVEVSGLGEHNSDAGPDFINTRVKVGGTVWAGNTEIHINSSDWTVHGHDRDKSYDNVVLHAVHKYDKPAVRSNGEIIPTITLEFDEQLYINYRELLHSSVSVACSNRVNGVEKIVVDAWLNALVVERLQHKTSHIATLLQQYQNNWDEVFYIVLARSFGFGLNAVPFELMARSLPYSKVMRHSDNPRQVEALIMGQAGFLDNAVLFNDYYSELRVEYAHLRKKYNLKPIPHHLWKFLRLRPVNFPTIRLAQFASLLCESEGLFSRVLACPGTRELISTLGIEASEFWNTHYTFEVPSPRTIKKPSPSTIQLLIINTVIPFLFIYGRMTGNDRLKERAINLLSDIPPEDNRIVRRWEAFGLKADSAFMTQGILQLNSNYCLRKKCLSCSIGTNLVVTSKL